MENEDRFDLKMVTKEEHCFIAPCGIYCGACDIFLGRSREHARELYRIMNGFNFADVGPMVMGIEQQKVQDFLDILDKWSQGEKCPGCCAGGGNPVCSIRACAQAQGFLTCAECDKMPCNENRCDVENQPNNTHEWLDLITKRYSHWNIDNLKRIQEIGYRRFIDEMQEKVEHGFLTSDVISKERVMTESFKRMRRL
ncbi:MAG: DUF3795 domain-containing protein [Chloroflexota bacterium]|nr:DUF3795 domain-containing protein [Chloroflexota bacterium]